MMKQKNSRRTAFTLIELIVAMAVFAVMMTALMQFYSATQKLWNGMSARTETFDGARVALDLISNDLQTILYTGDAGVKSIRYDSGSNTLSFGAIRSDFPHAKSESKVVKVVYRFVPDDKKLKLCVIPDRDTEGNINADWKITDPDPFANDGALDNNKFTTIAEGVVEFELALKNAQFLDFADGSDGVPPLAEIKLGLIDSKAMIKLDLLPSGDQQKFIVNNKRTFTRLVVIDRGQF